nr:retrovirus-related Pol polyprotein from transposon TNT 1-94 [Tanacetum cinerariifolium]
MHKGITTAGSTLVLLDTVVVAAEVLKIYSKSLVLWLLLQNYLSSIANEFDLWKMRIEQYCLMTDYSLWEVILNGESPPPTRIVNGVVQVVAPTTAEQRLAKKNKLKARGTLLMALPDKHQLKFNIHKDARSLMEAIEKIFRDDLEEHSLDDLFNNLKIYEAEVKDSSPSSQNTQNIAFVSSNNTDSINESLTATPSISTASSKTTISTLPKVDSLSYAVIYSFFARLHSHEYDNKVPKTTENDRYKTSEGHHAVLPQYTGTFMPLKPDLVFTDDPAASESVANVFNVESSTHKHSKDMINTYRPDAPIVEDWIANSKDETEIESVPNQKEPSFVKSTKHVNTSRESVKKVKHNKQTENLRTNNQKSRVKHVVNKAHSPVKRSINLRTTTKNSNFNKKVTTVKANKVNVVQGNKGTAARHTGCGNQNGNPQQALNDKGVINSGCSRHMTGNISFLLDFEEIDGGYVAFGGNPKGDIECVVLSSHYKLHDENLVLLRVLRENNMYIVDLKNVVPSEGLTCLFAKATLDESNLWHMRLEHINFKTMNKLVKGNLVRGLPSKIFENNHTCVACQKGKQHKASGLTCLFAKATLDESNLWHMRLGHINFKTMNKLVKGNLVRGLPLKIFENNHTCVACQKGKQHKASWIRPKWLFDIDTLTMSMNYQQVVAGNQPNDNAGIKENLDADDDVVDAAFDVKENKNDIHVSTNGSDKNDNKKHDEKAKRDDKGKSHVNVVSAPVNAARPNLINSTNNFNTASPSVNVVSLNFRIAGKYLFVDPFKYPDDPNMPELEDIVYLDNEEEVGTEADLSNLKTNIPVNLILTTRVHKDHHVNQIIGDLNLALQSRSMTRMVKEQGIDYDEVFAPVARIEAIRLFLAYASFIGFMAYQMDVKSAFLYGTIEEEVYVCQPLGFKDPDYPDKIDQTLFIKKQKGDILLVQVYVNDIICGSTNKELCKAFEKLIKDKFQMSSMGELTFFLGLQVKQKDDGIFISQDKYVAEILRKFGFTDVKSASTLIETEKPLLKDPDGEDVDVHIYRSMIGSLIYLASSRPDIMFAVYACARFQVTQKVSHLHAVKRFFRYLKGKPHLGLWYPSPFNLVAYSDSDYAGASLDRKSITEGCQFLVNASRHFITAVSYELMLFGLLKFVVVNVMLLDASEGFDQIVDFLNAHTIKYALVVNPTIYVSCIKQFWATAIVKKVNDDVQLRTLIDGKKMVFSEAIIRRDLHLDDADGVEYLPNDEVLRSLQECAKRTAWNEFSYSMASAVICLVVMDHQVDDMITHNTRHISPALTQKVFANMRRVGKGFSCVETPLFDSMLVQPQPQADGDVEIPIAHVDELEKDKHSQALKILQLKKRVKKLERKKKSKSSGLKRPRRVGTTQRVESSTDGRLNQEDVNDVSKGVSAVSASELVSVVEPTLFDDEDVIMTMTQTLIKLKVEKAKLLDEQIAQKLHDEEVQKAAARDKQEKADMKRALELQR